MFFGLKVIYSFYTILGLLYQSKNMLNTHNGKVSKRKLDILAPFVQKYYQKERKG